MIQLEDIQALIESRKNRVLTCAQIGMSEFQFQAFRKIFLDEFGKSGLGSDLEKLLGHSSIQSSTRQGKGRNILCKGGGVP